MEHTFIEPCLSKRVAKVPAGPGWLHEPKLDGWRIQLSKRGSSVALFTRSGNDCARRLPRLARAFLELPDCVIDGELVADDGDRIGNVFSVQRATEGQMAVMAFDTASK